jgi:hypothetical protein
MAGRLVLFILLAFSSPLLHTGFGSQFQILGLLLNSVLWILWLRAPSGTGKKIVYLIIVCLIAYFSLVQNGLINPSLELNRQRLFFIDSNYGHLINRFSEWSVYLPYRFRPMVFSVWIIPVSLLGRAFSLLWFDQIIPVIGYLAVIPLLAAVAIRRQIIAPLLLVFISVLCGGLARNPNTSSVFILVLPQLITLIRQGLRPLDPR